MTIASGNVIGADSNGAQIADVIAVKEGADLDLSCPIVVPNEDMVISWMCDNEPANIRSSRIHITDSGKLRIKLAKVGDSCNYRCETANGFGTVSVIIKVIIVDKRLMEQLTKQNQTNYHSTNNNARPKHTLSEIHSNSDGRKSDTTSGQSSLSSDGIPSSVVTANEVGDVHETTASKEEQQDDLEVRVEPEVVNVDKNRTFSLECRANHAPNQKAPQIIWLKQYNGRKPNSLSEALDQNLVTVDNVYYYSLNWPRSITFSKRSAGANSALLVRQASFVHSGRYVCFAGYPPYTMSSNLTSITQPRSGNQINHPLKYKMAMATVHVNDLEGEASHRLALETANVNQWFGGVQQQQQQKSLLYSIVSDNSWTRNLTLTLILLCGILYAIKLIHVRYRSGAKKRPNRTVASAGVPPFV